MQTRLDCIPCFMRQALQAARFCTDDSDRHEQVLRAVLKAVDAQSWQTTPADIACSVHFTVMDVLGIDDPYRKQKELSNKTVLALYDSMKESIVHHADPLHRAVEIAIAGNIMDYGALTHFDFADTMETVHQRRFAVNDVDSLKNDLKEAKTIAYLADNAGEIVCDRLLMETVTGLYGDKEWHLFVKARPIINDATLDDAASAGFHPTSSLRIDTVDMDRFHDDRTDDDFRSRLARYDVVISKGQGNYETLSTATTVNLYFLLMAKCHLIAGDLGVDTGDIIALKMNNGYK